jgi:Sec-independent protein secretion pathway component TatC
MHLPHAALLASQPDPVTMTKLGITVAVIGMLLTPPDVISQIILAVPVYLLYEVGIIMSKLFKSGPVK